MNLTADRLQLDDDPIAISDYFYEQGWTDGLPIVPPTPDRVEAILERWNANPTRSIGALQPSFQEASLERMAIAAVMAGCKPEHFPAVVGSVQAMLDPGFNVNAVQCTTSSTTPALVFNGPIRDELDFNYAGNCMGPGRRANAVIGRAVRLIMLNIGGAIPQDVDKASVGQPGKYIFCLAENEDANPWEPFHVERGFDAGDSVVSAFGATGSLEARDSSSKSAEGMMKTFAHCMTTAAFVAASNGSDGGQCLLVLVPEHAQFIAAAGYSKTDAKRWIWEEATMSLDDFSEEYQENIVTWQQANGLYDGKTVYITRSPEDIWIVVAGGAGSKSAFIPMWGGSTKAASVAVPSDFS